MGARQNRLGIGTAKTDRARYMRSYQAMRRGSVSYKTLAEDAAVLIAYAAGEVSEGRAAKSLGVDRLELRGRYRQALDLAAKRCGVEVADERLMTWMVDAGMGGLT